MLLTMKQMTLLQSVGKNQFEARKDLTKEEKAELLALDNWHYSLEGEHLNVNYNDLK